MGNTLLNADIFFFISSVATVILFLLLSIALTYAILILRSVRKVTQRIELGSETVARDLYRMRLNMIAQAFALWNAFASFSKRVSRFGKKY